MSSLNPEPKMSWVPAELVAKHTKSTVNQVVRKAYQVQDYLELAGGAGGNHRIHIDKKIVYLEKPLALKVREAMRKP